MNNHKIIYQQYNYQEELLIIITKKYQYKQINILTKMIIQPHKMLKVMISDKINFKNKSWIKVEILLIIIILTIKMIKITIIQVWVELIIVIKKVKIIVESHTILIIIIIINLLINYPINIYNYNKINHPMIYINNLIMVEIHHLIMILPNNHKPILYNNLYQKNIFNLNHNNQEYQQLLH